jgi:VRR-NUC domain-containing protein
MTRRAVVLETLTRPTMSERALQTAVIEAALWAGWLVAHVRDSRSQNVVGLPDLILARPGRIILAELKSERGRLSPAQEKWIGVLKQVPGVEAYVWRPSDLDQIIVILRR